MKSPYLRNGYLHPHWPFWDMVFWRKIRWQCTDLHSLFLLTELYVTLQKIFSMLRQWAGQFPSSHFGLETLNVLENKVNKAQCQTQERQVLIRDSFGLDCCHLELLIGSLYCCSALGWFNFCPIRSALLLHKHWVTLLTSLTEVSSRCIYLTKTSQVSSAKDW